MSFDAHSLERLRQLGRSLPQRLPQPDLPVAPAEPSANRERRHLVETETDPEALFRELMQVSPDGSVPPHLLDRLREAEAAKQQQRRPAAAPAPAPAQRRLRRSESAAADAANQELYAAFQQLLLEDEEED